jgi:parvulin-like peptidyl-prolyl isomerase
VRLTETVNIGQRELRQQVRQLEEQLGRELTRENRSEVLEAKIGDVLLNQAAARAGIRVSQEEIDQAIAAQKQSVGRPVSDAEFRRIIEQQTGLAWDRYVEEIRDRLVQERYILQESQAEFQQIGEPTPAEIRQVYEENASQFTSPAMVRFEHLFFDVRGKSVAEQDEIRDRAVAMARNIGSSSQRFGEYMKDSLDDVTYAGGDFGYLLRGDESAVQQLGRSFVNAVFELSDGDISSVLESNVGYHIIRVTDRRAPRLLNLNDPILPGESVTVRRQIVNYIRNQKQQQIFQRSVNRVLQQLREEAEIRRFEENLDW